MCYYCIIIIIQTRLLFRNRVGFVLLTILYRRGIDYRLYERVGDRSLLLRGRQWDGSAGAHASPASGRRYETPE